MVWNVKDDFFAAETAERIACALQGLLLGFLNCGWQWSGAPPGRVSLDLASWGASLVDIMIGEAPRLA